ncbi:hypothetical protein V1519DRAFT_29116 [Lipomyces tetrasporus]
MFDLFSLKRKIAATPDAIPQTPSPGPYSISSTKRRKVDTDNSRQSQLHVSASSPLLPSSLGISSFQSSQANGTDPHNSDNELYFEAKRRKLLQSSGNNTIPDSQGSSQSSNNSHVSANSQTQDGTEKFTQSSRKYASGALPSYGQNGYHGLPSWSKASVYRPATSTPSGPQYLPASVASTSCQVTGPVISNEPSSTSSESTPYTPDSMRIDTLSRYKVNVPPETMAPSQKAYPGSASQLWSEPSDRRYILPEPTVSPIRGRVSPDKPYSGPPPVIQSWSNISLPLPDRDGASSRNSPHTPGESPVPSSSVGLVRRVETSANYTIDGQSRSSVSNYYRSSPPLTSKNRPSRSSLYGYPPPPLPLPELPGRHKHESASDTSSSAKSNASKSVYRIEDSRSSKTKSGASPRESRILTDFRTPISLPSPISRPTAENKSSDNSVASIATAATSRAIDNLKASTSYSRTTSYSKRVTYPESYTRSTDTTSYGGMAEQIMGSLSTSRTGSSVGKDRDVTAASEIQVQQPSISSTSASISSAPQSPSTPVATHVSFPSSMSSSNSMKSIHPVLSRLKSSESLQQRRSPGSNLSLSGLQEPKRSESMERNDMELKSSSLVPITASSTTASVSQDSINGEGLSSSNSQGPAVRQSDASPSQAIAVDDSCSKCGISAGVLVEYAKVKEELVVKKKQWEVYFGEDQDEKSVMKEEIESLKEQMQAEIEVMRMDRDNLRMDRDNLKRKLDAQQQLIDELTQQLDAQRDEIRPAGEMLPSGGAHSIGNGVAMSMESSATVNSPATTDSVCSVSEVYDGGLNDKDSEAIEHDGPAKGDVDEEVHHQMITRSRSSKVTNGLEQNVSNSVETAQQPSELDHILSTVNPITFRRTMEFTSRSPFPVESAVGESSSRNGSILSKGPFRPGRKLRPRLLFDSSNLKALHVHRVGKFGKKVSFGEEDDKPGPFGLEPRNAVPVLRDYILGFREGVIDPRTKRLKRGMPVLKVGRKIPGELLKS